MRWLLAALLIALASPAALAQTTTFNAGDCSPYVTISNSGRTVTATANPNNSNAVTCQANVGKYSGKWYFRATPNTIGWSLGIGLANLGYSSSNPTASNIGADPQTVGYVLAAPGGYVHQVVFGPNGQRLSASFTYSSGTMAVAVDMDSNPRQIWVTPDISGTSGCGCGPVWNGDTTTYSAPVYYATGTPGTGAPCGGTGSGTYGPGDTGDTGLQFFLEGAYPAVTVQDYSLPASQATFDFTDSTTLDSVIPTYLPWNASGGAASVPGPYSPMVQNVANAPAWRQNTAYPSFGYRVLAGPAYNPGTRIFTNGLPLYLWAVAPGGGGTSGNNSTYAGHFGTAPCPTPAGIGGTVAPGGYSGSGISQWNAATHVTEGTVTWVCLTSVDYNTFTGANVDDTVNWASTAGYFVYQFVISTNGNVYMQWNRPTYPATTCTSGSTAPTATVFGASTSDGSCSWIYEGTLGYSSKANLAPHQQNNYWINSGAIAMVPQKNYAVSTQLWWGGTAQQDYENNAGGESQQIFSTMHYNQPYDGSVLLVTPGAFSLSTVNGFPQNQHVTAAIGDGFADNMNPASDPLRYDPTKGVSLFSSVTYNHLGLQGGHPGNVGAAYSYDDLNEEVDRLMLQSTSGPALAQADCGPGSYNGNGQWIHQDYLDSGGGGAGCGDGALYTNDVWVFRGTGIWASASGTGSGSMGGTYSHYGNTSYNNTIIGPGFSGGSGTCANCDAIHADRQAQYGPIQPGAIRNNLVFGYGQQFGYVTGANTNYDGQPDPVCGPSGCTPPYATNAGNNGSDLPTNYTGTTFTNPAGILPNVANITTIPFPGGDSARCGAGNNQPCFGLVATDVFVNPVIGPSLDLRLCTPALCMGRTSPAIGAGVNFSYSGYIGASITLTPGNDILGQPRTRSGVRSVDLGAVQAAMSAAPPAPVPGGGFQIFR